MVVAGSKIGTGRTSELYSYGTDSVLKVLRPGVPEQWAEIEYVNARLAYEAGVPAPEPRALLSVGSQPAIVYQRVRGHSLWDEVVMGSTSVRRAARIIAELNAVVSMVPAPPGLRPLVERLEQKLGQVDLPERERTQARAFIARLAPGSVLVHGDLHPGNVVMGNEPTLVDWFDAAAGSPWADVARTAVLVGIGRVDDSAGVDLPHLPRATGEQLRALADEYRRVAFPLDDQDRFCDLVAVMALCRLAENAQPADELRHLWATVSRRRPWFLPPRLPLS